MAVIYRLDRRQPSYTVVGKPDLPVERSNREAALDAWLRVTRFNTPHVSAADILDALRQITADNGDRSWPSALL